MNKSTATAEGFRLVGPGLVLAATGIGVGDMVPAALAGSKYGLALLWAVAAGAIIKFALSEAIARRQLERGTTLFEAWRDQLGPWANGYFFVYLLVWTAAAGAAVISACGLALHAFFPAISVRAGGAIHAIVGALCVLRWRYGVFEKIMALFVGAMCVAIGATALLSAKTMPLASVASTIPPGGIRFTLGIIGGVGGSLTLLSYPYWIREHRWEGPAFLPLVRRDLVLTYGVTALFGMGTLALAAGILFPAGGVVEGAEGVLRLATMLEGRWGVAGLSLYLLGFWAAAASSLLGTFQSVPILFCDFVATMKNIDVRGKNGRWHTVERARLYRGFLLYLVLAPLVLVFVGEPFVLILLFTIVAAFFLPFLAGSLLWIERGKGHWLNRAVLMAAILLFTYLGVVGIVESL